MLINHVYFRNKAATFCMQIFFPEGVNDLRKMKND